STLATAAIAQTGAVAVTAGEGKAAASPGVPAPPKNGGIRPKTPPATPPNAHGGKKDGVCGDDGRKFAQLKGGDERKLEYYESRTLKLEKVAGEPAMSEKTSEVRAEPGELPGGVKTRETTITAKVTAVDTAKNTITIVGPKGNSHVLDAEP